MGHKSDTTSKKVKIIGTQEFLNTATGEVEQFQVTSVEERDFDFCKVWMKSFIATLDQLGTKKLSICLWIIENINRDNQLIYTQEEIAKNTKTSRKTVIETINLLLNTNFLRKKSNGVYVINPDIIYKGTRNNRLNALTIYQDAKKKEIKISPEEMIANYKNTIKTCQKIIQDTEKKLTEMKNHQK